MISATKMTTKEVLYQHLNDSFDHVYLITLKRSTDRHDRIRKMLKGLDYEIFWGVDGEKLTDGELEGKYDDTLARVKNLTKKGLTAGEIGCTLSHTSIYRDILDKGYNHALILEDDLVVDTNQTEFLGNALAELPEDWELLFVGYLNNNETINFPIRLRIRFLYPILSMLGFKRFNANHLRCKFPRPYSKYFDRAGFHFGTHAYAVTASGVQKILNDQTPVTMAPDNALGMMCMKETIKAYRLKKKVFHQNRDLPTTIKGRYKN